MCNENTIEKLKSGIDAYVAECPVNPESAELKLRIALLREAGPNPLEAVELRFAVTRLAMLYPAPLHVAVIEIAKRAYDQIPKDLNHETLMGMFSDYVGDRQTDRLLAAERLQIVLFMLGQLKVTIAAIMQSAVVAAQQIDPGYRAELMESVETSLAEIRSYRRQRHINNNVVYGATYSAELLLYGIKKSGIKRGELTTLGGTLPWTAVPEAEAKPVRDSYNEWLGQFSPDRFPTLNPCGEVPIPDTGRGFTESAVTFDELATVPDVSSPLHKMPSIADIVAALRDASYNRAQPTAAYYLPLNENQYSEPKEANMKLETVKELAKLLGPMYRTLGLAIHSGKKQVADLLVEDGAFATADNLNVDEVTALELTENYTAYTGSHGLFIEIREADLQLGRPMTFRLITLETPEDVKTELNLQTTLKRYAQYPAMSAILKAAKSRPTVLPTVTSNGSLHELFKVRKHPSIEGAFLAVSANGDLRWVDESDLVDPELFFTAEEVTLLKTVEFDNAPDQYSAELIKGIKKGHGWSIITRGRLRDGDCCVILAGAVFIVDAISGRITGWAEDAAPEFVRTVESIYGWTGCPAPEEVLSNEIVELNDTPNRRRFYYGLVAGESYRTITEVEYYVLKSDHPMFNFYRQLQDELTKK